MKILYICIGKLNIENWSGTTYKIYEQLKKNEDVTVLELTYSNRLLRILYKIYNRINESFKKK